MGLVAIMLSLIVITAGTSIITMSQIGEEIHSVTETDMPITTALTQVTIHQLEQAVLFEKSIISTLLLASDPSEAARFKEIQEKFSSLSAKLGKELSDVEAIAEMASP